MKHRLARSVIGALLLALPVQATVGSFARAQVQQADTELERLIDRLMVEHHTRESLQAWRSALAGAGSHYADYGFDARTTARLQKCWRLAVESSFDLPRLLDDIRRTLRLELNRFDVEALLALRESDVGKKISKRELELVVDLRNREILVAMAAEAKRLEADREREVLVEAIMELHGSEQALRGALRTISVAVQLGSEASKPAGVPRYSADEIERRVEAEGAATWAGLKSTVRAQDAYVYRDLNLSELEIVREFLSTPFGKRTTRAGLMAFERSMHAQALRTGARFAELWQMQEL